MEYNSGMNRKKRSDRNHLIYQLGCLETGDTYIGITSLRGKRIDKALATRWQQHQYRAMNQNKDWALCKAIRANKDWVYEAICVIRGKAEAHAKEVSLIDEMQPTLNTLRKTLCV